MAGIPCDGIVAQETSGPSTSLGMTVWGSHRTSDLSGSPGWLTPISVERSLSDCQELLTVKLVSRLLAVSACNAYPAAIMGTAARAAIIPTVFQRVNRSPKKMRARTTVRAG